MAYNPYENKIIEKIERSGVGEQALIARAFAETQKEIQKNKIKIEDFRGMYDANIIAEDLAYVEKMNNLFEDEATDDTREAKKLAAVFEGVFHKGAHEYGWFGEGVRVIKTSDVEDWRDGIDGIVEFQEKDKSVEHLAIGVDVTYSNLLEEKFKKIKDKIECGELPTIKYFRSGNFKGELKNIPQVVVGVERSHLIKLCRDIFIKPDKEKLKRHPFQILQLKQMRLQLDAFSEYAEQFGQTEIACVYRRDAEIVRSILQKKSVIGSTRMGKWEDDRVFTAIKKELENLK